MQSIQPLLETCAEVWGVSVSEAAAMLSLDRFKSVRLNTLKARKSTLQSLRASGITLEPIAWAPNCYTPSSAHDQLSSHPTVASGEVFLQNAASFVPVLALDPQAGEQILDMAAAPGGKTSHIAAIVKNKAHIIANDTSKDRFFKMRQIFDMLGVKADTALYDGRDARKNFAGQQFDRILLDAPCSGEAAIDPAQPKSYAAWTPSKVKRLSRLQEQLLVTAYDCLRVGGTLVYSTCTINPEENEFVVARLLKRRSATLLPINQAPADSRSGITTWQGKQLPADIASCVRLLPSAEHEAFFVAKITKTTDTPEDYYFTA